MPTCPNIMIAALSETVVRPVAVLVSVLDTLIVPGVTSKGFDESIPEKAIIAPEELLEPVFNEKV